MKILTCRVVRLVGLVTLLMLSGCVGLKPSYTPLLPAVEATPLIAQQQWRVTMKGEHYPLLAVVERESLGFTLVIMNNFGARLATVSSRGGPPQLEKHLSHPVDAYWLRLVQGFQWAFWPPELLSNQPALGYSESESGDRQFHSAIVRASVSYGNRAANQPVWQSWEAEATIDSPDFSLFIQSLVVTH